MIESFSQMDVEFGIYVHNILTETNVESQDTSENMRYLILAFRPGLGLL